MKKPTRAPGTFLKIPLADGSMAYGRELELPYTAFYDYRTTEPESDLDVLESKPVLFTLSVRGTTDRWTPLGVRPLRGRVAEPVVQFMQDIGDYRSCTIFDTAGNEREASPEECVGLERAVVWEPEHVEERLLDTFLGRTNPDEERYRVRLQDFKR